MFERIWRATLPVLASLALAGCFLQPGKFDSTLDLHKDGTFDFAYKGQITVLPLSKDGEQAKPADDADKGGDSQQIAMMRAMLVGIDPSDPDAGPKLADRLRGQAGWHQVDYIGNGVFEVDFSVSSKLTHDFVFPTIEGFPMGNVFVMANSREGGMVRVEAPGFSTEGSGNPMQGLVAGMAGAFGAAAPGSEEGDSDIDADTGKSADSGEAPDAAPSIPAMDGTFRVVTDGEITDDNADAEPQIAAGGKVLQWTVNSSTQSPPAASIRLAR